jgi:hypothetical protein
MVEKIARERRTPVLQHTHEGAAGDLRRDVLLEGLLWMGHVWLTCQLVVSWTNTR